MKITQLRDKDKTTALTTMDMETWIGKTRTETKTRPVSAFREVLRYSLPDSRCYEADKLPKILPAAEFRRAEGGKQMKSYNGIVELTVGPLSGGPEITLVKQLACGTRTFFGCTQAESIRNDGIIEWFFHCCLSVLLLLNSTNVRIKRINR